jgi:predicted polyphosphate/ATP-dependent NAD kinase
VSSGINNDQSKSEVQVKKKFGLIVNPVAGMGGRVGLKGSDGQEIFKKAVELGAVPISPGRTVEALRRVAQIMNRVELLTCSHDMGEDEAKECHFEPLVVYSITKGNTTPADTINAAREMMRRRVDLILFAGGDGTARNIYEAIGDAVPVLGIPAGVKVQSGVFAINPRSAGELAAMYLQDKPVFVREAEVMDIDEQAFREDRVSSKLYGYLRVIYERSLVQGSKVGSASGEEDAQNAIASEIVENMDDNCLYVIGPGTTLRPILERLGLKKTLLGVDVLSKKKLLASDVNEKQLLETIDNRDIKIVVTVIGGQGFIFGRGNQQISPQVIRKAGKESIVVAATEGKLASLEGAPLMVDTGDPELDRSLSGYVAVITGYRRKAIYRVKQS